MASTRLPGKPLADIGGTPMIVHTWKAATQHPDIDRVCVATDHPDIAAAVRDAGGEAVMTSVQHTSGTERCAEAAQSWADTETDALLNLQGDEPFPDPDHLAAICALLRARTWDVVSAMRPAKPSEIPMTQRVKVAAGQGGRALYFSRSPIPFEGPHHIHIGIYGFAPGQLLRCASLSPGILEKQEQLEQLRWLEHGISLGMVPVQEHHSPSAVDTPEDLEKVRSWYAIHNT